MDQIEISECALKAKGCKNDLEAQQDISIEASTGKVTAKETNTEGYSYEFCYTCTIINDNDESFTFQKDSI